MKKISNIENISNFHDNSDTSVYQQFKNKIFHDPFNCPKRSSDDKSSRNGKADLISERKEKERENELRDCMNNKFDLAVWGASYVELAYRYFTGKNIKIFPCVNAFCTCTRDSSRSNTTGTSEDMFKHQPESCENVHDSVDVGDHDSGDKCEGQCKRTDPLAFAELPVYFPPIRSMLHKELDYKPPKERYTETPAHRFLLPYVSMVRKTVQKPIVWAMNGLENFMVRRGLASPGQWSTVRMREQALKSNEGYSEQRNVMAATLGGGAGYALACYQAKWPANTLYRKLLYTSGGGALAALACYQLQKSTDFSHLKLKRVRRE